MNYFLFFRGFIIGFVITAIFVFLCPLFGSYERELIVVFSMMGGFLGGIFDLAMTNIHNS